MFRRPQTSLAVRAVTGVAVTACLFAALPALAAHAAGVDRIDLRVLLVTNGDSNVEAIRAQLATENVPTTVVDLSDAARPAITPGFLSDMVSTGPRAKYQSVVLPNDAGGGLSVDEVSALTAYEVQFGIRQVDAYNYPAPSVGLNSPTSSGSLDGQAATVTPAGLQTPFQYLKGTFSVDNYLPDTAETYGYLAAPLFPGFTPLVTVSGNPIVGSYADSGREQLVITASFNSSQTWFRVMAHGFVTWMTKGVHLGYDRNYFAVQADDVLLPDARWNTAYNCTTADGCPAGVADLPDIRMTPADVTYLAMWQKRNNFMVDLAFNAAGSVDGIATTGSDPLTTSLLASRNSFNWVNHTYSHEFLGCLQDFTVVPWRCQTDSAGKTLYMSRANISAEISKNISWARQNRVQLTASELVTGEHSGLAVAPQQPKDSPNLAGALAANGITSIASDASREVGQRIVGSASTVPRHPMNIFYNAATPAEEVDEYNWIYTSAADGGSGLCEGTGSTCIAPLTSPAGFLSYLVPLETRIALGHVLANDPAPHFIHQSNLAEGRIGYPVLEGVLKQYWSMFATNAGLLNLRLGQQGTVLRREAAWKAISQTGVISAYTLGGKVFVTSTSSGKTLVPLTVPQNVLLFGLAYAGERSDYATVSAGFGLALLL
ncbi:MAG TPA: hypothetical protein VIJ15_00905 [Dermatophilaceae bacterium]